MVMKPSPPICTSANMTAWPKVLQWEYVSVTVSPVKLKADVAVKSDIVNPDETSDLEETGNDSAMVPIAIRVRNTVMKTTKNGAWFGGKRDLLRCARTLSYILATGRLENHSVKIFV